MVMQSAVSSAVLLLTMGLSPSSAQPQEAITFKGFPLNGTIEQFQARFPEFKCEGSRCWVDTRICVEQGSKASRDPKEQSEATMACLQRNTYGGVGTLRISATFEDAKLAVVYVTVGTKRFADLSSAMTTRFGRAKIDRETVQSKLGAKCENEILTWESGDAILRASKYSSNLDEASVLMTSKAHAARLQQERGRNAEKGAKDL